MNISQRTKTILYLLLILTGWGVGQYCQIPSFNWLWINHIQPDIAVFDKAISVTLFTFSLTIYFALWHNKWLNIVMVFITAGFLNNMIDELNNKASILTTTEQVSLLFALTTTSYLIWKRHKVE